MLKLLILLSLLGLTFSYRLEYHYLYYTYFPPRNVKIMYRQPLCILPYRDDIPNCNINLKVQPKDSNRNYLISNVIKGFLSLEYLEKVGMNVTEKEVRIEVDSMPKITSSFVNIPTIPIDSVKNLIIDVPIFAIVMASKCYPDMGIPFCGGYNSSKLLNNNKRYFQLSPKLEVYEAPYKKETTAAEVIRTTMDTITLESSSISTTMKTTTFEASTTPVISTTMMMEETTITEVVTNSKTTVEVPTTLTAITTSTTEEETTIKNVITETTTNKLEEVTGTTAKTTLGVTATPAARTTSTTVEETKIVDNDITETTTNKLKEVTGTTAKTTLGVTATPATRTTSTTVEETKIVDNDIIETTTNKLKEVTGTTAKTTLEVTAAPAARTTSTIMEETITQSALLVSENNDKDFTSGLTTTLKDITSPYPLLFKR